MEVVAKAKYLRISPYKARVVARLVKGKKADEALGILAFTNKKFARMLSKVIRSAIANAEHNTGLDVDRLWVKNVIVDEGPMWKRWRPRAMGRATMILKRTSHVTVILEERR